MAAPQQGPCEQWATIAEVRDCCVGLNVAITDAQIEAAIAWASSFLFRASARLFPGACSRTLYPCRGNNCDDKYGLSWWFPQFGYPSYPFTLGPEGFGNYWWTCHEDCCVPCVPLPGPIVEVKEVVINGQVLTPDAYRVNAHTEVCRVDGLLWPSSNNLNVSAEPYCRMVALPGPAPTIPGNGGVTIAIAPTGTQTWDVTIDDPNQDNIVSDPAGGLNDLAGSLPTCLDGSDTAAVYHLDINGESFDIPFGLLTNVLAPAASGTGASVLLQLDFSVLTGCSQVDVAAQVTEDRLEALYQQIGSTTAPITVSGVECRTEVGVTNDGSRDGAWQITYTYGIPIPPDARLAAASLACQVALARCGSDNCRLPGNVASMAREDTLYTFTTIDELSGMMLTGLPEVDLWVKSVNPHGVMQRGGVFSVDELDGIHEWT